MRALIKNELTRMQDAQQEAMMDLCVLMTAAVTPDALNQPVATWTDSLPISCGLGMTGGQRTGPDNIILLSWDATLRLPKDTTVSQANRVRVLERYGQPWTEIVYTVQSVDEGPSGLFLRLKKLEPSA